MHLEFVPKIIDLPKDHVVIFFGKIGKTFVAIHGPKEKTIPKRGTTCLEIWGSTVSFFNQDGNLTAKYPVKHGHKYNHTGGMTEFKADNEDRCVGWKKEDGGKVVAGLDGSVFQEIYIAL